VYYYTDIFTTLTNSKKGAEALLEIPLVLQRYHVYYYTTIFTTLTNSKKGAEALLEIPLVLQRGL
jgi:hypothetical protein